MDRDYTKEPITRDEALTLLENVIKGREDYVQQSCTYLKCGVTARDLTVNENGEYEPACIVGHVIAAAGISLDLLSTCNGDEFENVTDAVLEHFTDEAIKLLAAAQRAQDGRVEEDTFWAAHNVHYPWGDAVLYAKSVA